MPKKIIISFDGTWNTPDSHPEIKGDESTNVAKLFNAITPSDSNNMTQLKWYEEGVGTAWYNKIRGGAFGVGLSEKIQEGYRFLAENYEDGDSVYIFGFSRGAYSARSLVGFIRNSGLLKKEKIKFTKDAYSLYRTRDEGADSENARFFRNNYSRDISIHFLGVWDTVGALGIPVESFKWFNKSYYQFHDTELSGIVKNAFHALAIDEHRKNYAPSLWNPKSKPNQKVEQVWFAGAHANVGGGYMNNNLSDIPLMWMAEKAKECGLCIDSTKMPSSINPAEPITDSYGEFLGGMYSKIEQRYFRPLGTTPFGNEIVDLSVEQRVQIDPRYTPKNELKEHIKSIFNANGKFQKN